MTSADPSQVSKASKSIPPPRSPLVFRDAGIPRNLQPTSRASETLRIQVAVAGVGGRMELEGQDGARRAL